MDSYRVCGQFEEPFGEPAAWARALAEGLGGMFEELHNTVTKEDLRILLESIDADVSRLDRSLERQAEAQTHTEPQVRELAEAQARTEANIARLDDSFAKLTEAQTAMATALQRPTIRTDDVIGRTLELQFRDRLTAYVRRFLRRGKLVPTDRRLDQLEQHLSERQVDDVLRADVIPSGLVDCEQTYLVVEGSWTGDIDDIVRADERAKLTRRASLPAISLLACNAMSPESTAFAKMRDVRVRYTGSLIEAEA